MMKTRLANVLAILLLLVGARPALAEPPAIRGVDDLLSAIEHADEGVDTIQADVLYDRRLELQGDRILRRGELYFVANESERKFAVRFETRIVDGVPRSEDELLIFDGRWFVEKKENVKQFIRREISRKDDAFDPLKLGEGPFPIPIGQEADDIRARYEATMPEIGDGLEEGAERENLLAFVAGSHQLHLVPRNKEDARLVDIRLWYRFKHGQLVPRLARTVDPRGDVTYVQLINVRLNEPIPTGALSVEPPEESDGWRVQEVRLPKPE